MQGAAGHGPARFQQGAEVEPILRGRGEQLRRQSRGRARFATRMQCAEYGGETLMFLGHAGQQAQLDFAAGQRQGVCQAVERLRWALVGAAAAGAVVELFKRPAIRGGGKGEAQKITAIGDLARRREHTVEKSGQASRQNTGFEGQPLRRQTNFTQR